MNLTCCPPLLLGKLYGPSISSSFHLFTTLTTPWPNLTYHNPALQGTTMLLFDAFWPPNAPPTTQMQPPTSTIHGKRETLPFCHPSFSTNCRRSMIPSLLESEARRGQMMVPAIISGAFDVSFRECNWKNWRFVFFGKIYHQRHWYLIIHCQLRKDLDTP